MRSPGHTKSLPGTRGTVTPPTMLRVATSRRAAIGPMHAIESTLSTLGGGGDRTRVLQYITRTSPGAARCGFLSPGGLAGEPPPGSVAVWCPAHPRDRAERWILLTDARHRAGGSPGLTTSNSRSGREGEVSALNIGTCKVRSQVLRGYVRSPRPASPGSTTEVETLSPPIELSAHATA